MIVLLEVYRNLHYMQTKQLSKRVRDYLTAHGITKKFDKQIKTLQENPRHPSLHTELLEPKSEKVHSFRIDRKYRALFIIVNSEIEIIDINDHYQ